MRLNDQKNTSELANQLREHMTEHEVSQGMVAKSIGCTAGVISAWLSGKYAGDIAGTEEKIRQYLVLESARADAHVLPTVAVLKTTAFATITNTLNAAAQKRALVSVTGESGIGKTTAIKEYARTHAAVMLIEVDDGFTSRDLFCELCELLGLPTRGTLHALLKRICDKLRGSGRLLIVDEAEYLPKRALDMLRRLRDFAQIPIALVGLPRLNENIQGDQNNFAQLSSRMRLRQKVDRLTSNDEEMIIHAYLGSVKSDVIKSLRKFSKQNARILVELIDVCLELCRLNKLTISAEVVIKAAELSGDAF